MDSAPRAIEPAPGRIRHVRDRIELVQRGNQPDDEALRHQLPAAAAYFTTIAARRLRPSVRP
jgi:hypothetical protein